MNEVQFRVDIKADPAKVWDTLWQDETLRQWAGVIDPGTYMVGKLEEGSEVQWISAENGYGVTSLVEKLVPGEFLLLLHSADTQDSGEHERDKQWTGGKESYELKEQGDGTTLSVAFDVPPELEDMFKVLYPKALAKIKELAEKG